MEVQPNQPKETAQIIIEKNTSIRGPKPLKNGIQPPAYHGLVLKSTTKTLAPCCVSQIQSQSESFRAVGIGNTNKITKIIILKSYSVKHNRVLVF